MQITVASPTSADLTLPAPAYHAGPILVAIDMTEESVHARTIAHLIADSAGAPLELLTVLEPCNEILPEPGPVVTPVHAGTTRIEDRHARLDAMLDEGTSTPESFDIMLGHAAQTIIRAADERDARLIVTGMAHHGALARIIRRDTPLAVVNGASVPVLAVPKELTHLPRQIVIAVNTGAAVREAGALGTSLMRDAVAVHLVHVKPQRPVYYEPASREADEEEEEAIRRDFAAVRAALHLPADVPVETHIYTGQLYDRLLAFAREVDAELIVVGHSPKLRLLPSRGLTARILRTAPCAVLLAPAPRIDADPAQQTRVSVREEEWPAMLHAFTQRNFGRALALAVDERHAGSSIVARGLNLVSADYDAKARTLTVAASDAGKGSAHLSHRIVQPSVLAMQRHTDNGDETLVAGYEDGQLILTLA